MQAFFLSGWVFFLEKSLTLSSLSAGVSPFILPQATTLQPGTHKEELSHPCVPFTVVRAAGPRPHTWPHPREG